MGVGECAEPLNIAVVHNHPSGGAARAIHELGKKLSRRHHLDVYTLTTDERFVDSGDYAQRVRTFPYAPRPPLRAGLYLNEWRAYRDLLALDDAYRNLARAVDAGGYDVVLASACRVLGAPSALAFLRTPAAYYCHEPPRQFVEPERRPDAGPLPLYRRLRAAWHRPAAAMLARALARRDRRNVAAARVMLTNSTFTAAAIGDYYGRDARVCPLGVDRERFVPGDRVEARYVLSVGAVDRHKGHDFVIEALARMPRDVRPPLVVIGNYANVDIARRLHAQAGASGVALTIRTAVAERELAAAYAGARVFAYAAHLEPFGLAVLEAMAAAVPVVAVREGGVVDSIVPDVTGTLVPRDAGAFAAALRALLDDEVRAAALGRQGRHVAETKWTWNAAARRVEDALADACGLTAGWSVA